METTTQTTGQPPRQPGRTPRPPPPEVIVKAQATQAKSLIEDAAARVALADPVPGPTAEALGPEQGIKVGAWTVRPMFDGDYQVLKALGHPYFYLMREAMVKFGLEPGAANMIPSGGGEEFVARGPCAWELCWIMTRKFREVWEGFRDHGAEWVRRQAADEFAERNPGELLGLCEAARRQVTAFWDTFIGYAAKVADASSPQGEEEAKAKSNPSESSGPRPTGSAGSPTSAPG